MHNYLRCIGLSKIKNKKHEELLLKSVIDDPDKKRLVSTADCEETWAELTKLYAPNIGIRIYGQYDEDDNFHLDYYFPFVEGRYDSIEEECYVDEKMGSTSYSGLCEDDRLGVALIFHINNTLDFVKNPKENLANAKHKVKLSALSKEATILLPTFDTVNVPSKTRERKQVKMLADARSGDREAIEKLTMQEIEAISHVVERVRSEDILSIVESSLLPYGVEAEVYKMLGMIISIKEYENANIEPVYLLQVLCNDILFDVCVNKEDLQGEPALGRRFYGIIWLQGKVNMD